MVCPLSHSNRRALAAVVIGGAVFIGLAYYYFYTKKSLGESFDGPTDRPAHLKKRKKRKRDKKKRLNSALNASSSSSPSPSENSTKTAKEPRRPTPTPTRRLPPSNADYPVPPTPSKIEKP